MNTIMNLILHDKKYKTIVDGKPIIGILVDCHFVDEKGENICVLEADDRDENNDFPLYDIWEHELEEA